MAGHYPNNALDFNGVNDFVTLGTIDASVTGANARTVEAWVRVDNTAVPFAYMLGYGDGSVSAAFRLVVSNGHFFFGGYF